MLFLYWYYFLSSFLQLPKVNASWELLEEDKLFAGKAIGECDKLEKPTVHLFIIFFLLRTYISLRAIFRSAD